MPPSKTPISATVDERIKKEVEEVWDKTPRGTSKSQVIEALLRMGLEHERQNKVLVKMLSNERKG